MNQQQRKERWQQYGATENGQLFRVPRPSRYEQTQHYDGAAQPPLASGSRQRNDCYGNSQNGERMEIDGAGHGLSLTC